MTVPQKKLWKAAASGGDPRLAIDDRYATVWTSEPSEKPWVEIDLGAVATLGGLEIYWGRRAAAQYEFHTSRDGKTWERLCGSPHGEGGQELFGFPPIAARFVRLSADNPDRNPGPEVVQINLYGPDGAVSVLEAGRIASLGSAPVRLPVGESITADFGYVRSPARGCGSTGERPTAPTSRSRSPKTAKTSAKWAASITDKGSMTISIGRA